MELSGISGVRVGYFHRFRPLFIGIEVLCESIVHCQWRRERPWQGALAKTIFVRITSEFSYFATRTGRKIAATTRAR